MALLKNVMETDVVPYKAQVASDRVTDGDISRPEDEVAGDFGAIFDCCLSVRGGVSTTMSLTLSVDGDATGLIFSSNRQV